MAIVLTGPLKKQVVFAASTKLKIMDTVVTSPVKSQRFVSFRHRGIIHVVTSSVQTGLAQ